MKIKFFIFFISVLIQFLILPEVFASENASMSNWDNVAKALVKIHISSEVQAKMGLGRGVFIAPDMVLTGYHVVRLSSNVVVEKFSNDLCKAQVFWVNKDIDIALLKTQCKNDTYLRVSSQKLQPGDMVYLPVKDAEEGGKPYANFDISAQKEQSILLQLPSGVTVFQGKIINQMRIAGLKSYESDEVSFLKGNLYDVYGVDIYALKGYGGSPILNSNNEIVGVLMAGSFRHTPTWQYQTKVTVIDLADLSSKLNAFAQQSSTQQQNSFAQKLRERQYAANFPEMQEWKKWTIYPVATFDSLFHNFIGMEISRNPSKKEDLLKDYIYTLYNKEYQARLETQYGVEEFKQQKLSEMMSSMTAPNVYRIFIDVELKEYDPLKEGFNLKNIEFCFTNHNKPIWSFEKPSGYSEAFVRVNMDGFILPVSREQATTYITQAGKVRVVPMVIVYRITNCVPAITQPKEKFICGAVVESGYVYSSSTISEHTKPINQLLKIKEPVEKYFEKNPIGYYFHSRDWTIYLHCQ